MTDVDMKYSGIFSNVGGILAICYYTWYSFTNNFNTGLWVLLVGGMFIIVIGIMLYWYSHDKEERTLMRDE